MKNSFILIISVILILGMASCSSITSDNNKDKQLQNEVKRTDKDKKDIISYKFDANIKLSLNDLVPYFSTTELLLVPQAEDEYPILNGVEAKAYELIDGGVYIHVFENNKELKKGANQIAEVYDKYEEWGLIVYEVNNMLFVYIPSYATEELKKENDKKMRNAIESMIKQSMTDKKKDTSEKETKNSDQYFFEHHPYKEQQINPKGIKNVVLESEGVEYSETFVRIDAKRLSLYIPNEHWAAYNLENKLLLQYKQNDFMGQIEIGFLAKGISKKEATSKVMEYVKKYSNVSEQKTSDWMVRYYNMSTPYENTRQWVYGYLILGKHNEQYFYIFGHIDSPDGYEVFYPTLRAILNQWVWKDTNTSLGKFNP